MKTTTLLFTSLLASALVVGCTRSTEKSATGTTATPAASLNQAAATTTNAARELQQDLGAEKAEYVAKMRTEMAELNRGLDEMAARIDRSGDAAKAEAAPHLAALREQAAQLNKQLATVADATPSTWSGIKADSEKAYTAFKDGVAHSRQWASDKIAP